MKTSKVTCFSSVILALLVLLETNTHAAPAATNGLFGAFPSLEASVYDGNVAFTTWLIGGVDQIRNALLKQSEATRITTADLDRLRKAARAEAKLIGNPSGPARTLAQLESHATDQLPALERVLFDAPEPTSRRLAEQNLQTLQGEVALVGTARQQISIYPRRLEELASTIDAWLEFWSITQAARGLESTREQVADLVTQELGRWNELRNHEIAEILLARNHRIPEGLSADLRSDFQKMDHQLPRFQGDPQITPATTRPLVLSEATNGISILLETTHLASPTIRMTGPDGQITTLDVTSTGSHSYRSTWHPPFLENANWHKRAQKYGRADLGDWRLTIELRSNPSETGVELLTSSTSISLHAVAEAPHGVATVPLPGKSKFLKKYPREKDIPLEHQHHVFSILAYPVLGFPRDLLDAVFGTVDKIPYLSLPISLVYAGPGQLLCKPWWDEAYRPFAQQSAGYYAWTGRDHDQWQFFENGRTWYWPESEDAGFLSLLFYLGLGFPRDVLDAPFGVMDQIPLISTPISYVYAPLTLVTKPWYAQHYTMGNMKGQERVPYCRQSRPVICMGDWSEQSQWVFFENFKTTTFRSPDTDAQVKLQRRHRREMANYQASLRVAEARNEEIRNTCRITLHTDDTEQRFDDRVTR